jgi:hypothetical protein
MKLRGPVPHDFRGRNYLTPKVYTCAKNRRVRNRTGWLLNSCHEGSRNHTTRRAGGARSPRCCSTRSATRRRTGPSRSRRCQFRRHSRCQRRLSRNAPTSAGCRARVLRHARQQPPARHGLYTMGSFCRVRRLPFSTAMASA